MSALKEAILSIIPEECLLSGSSTAKAGKTFALRKSRIDEIVVINLDALCLFFGLRHKIADNIFICYEANRRFIFIIIVELKGVDSRYGLSQIIKTTEVFCRNSSIGGQFHSQKILDWARAQNVQGHEAMVLGLLITKRSLPKNQFKAATAKYDNRIIFKSITTDSFVTTIEEIRKKFKLP